ncbi:MAG: hypothetical protein KKD18_06640 [Nanoarchaeota archaeon]|nr:hypothetical protein [Nanoarchaeota archaeon]
MRQMRLIFSENEFENLEKMKKKATKIQQLKVLSWEKFIFQNVMRNNCKEGTGT